MTLSNVAFQHTRDGYYHGDYHIAGSVANTGSEDIDSYRIYYRFYRGDGTLLYEEYLTQLSGTQCRRAAGTSPTHPGEFSGRQPLRVGLLPDRVSGTAGGDTMHRV